MESERGQVTDLLIRFREGDRHAEAQLIPLVYDELRRLASRYLNRERGDHTPTDGPGTRSIHKDGERGSAALAESSPLFRSRCPTHASDSGGLRTTAAEFETGWISRAD